MVSIDYSIANLSEAYHGYRNPKTHEVTVLYDDKNIRDEEMTYTFRPDGSATAVSHAWGTKSERPAGTFSDILLKLPNKEVLNAELAQELVNIYQKSGEKYN